MTDPSKRHDALFKAIFSQVENAIGELKELLPGELVEQLDLSSATHCPGSFVDEELRQTHSDLLFSVSLRGQPREVLVYVLMEHQSTDGDAFTALRLLGYMNRVWVRWLAEHQDATKLPAIIPLVLYHGPTGWRPARQFLDLIDLPEETLEAVRRFLPAFEYRVDDLSQVQVEALQARATTVTARITLVLLKESRGGRSLLAA